MSHRSPQLVGRLVGAVNRASPGSPVVIRHDPRFAPLRPHHLHGARRTIVVTDDEIPEWGGFGIVAVMLALFRWAVERLDVDHVVLLSGDSYPTGPLAPWESWLRATPDGSVATRVLDGRPRWGRSRVDDDAEFCRLYRSGVIDVGRVLAPVPVPLRPRAASGLRGGAHRLSRNLQPVLWSFELPDGRLRVGLRRTSESLPRRSALRMGSNWVALGRTALTTLLREVDDEPGWLAAFRRTHCPDELVVHTVLGAHPDLAIANRPTHHVRFPRRGAASPDVLALVDLDEVVASGLPFTRKVDLAASAGLLHELDRCIDRG